MRTIQAGWDLWI